MAGKKIKTDIVIIGAGIIGCCLARQLSRYKVSVIVIEKEEDVGWGTTKANSGILHAGYAGEPGSLKLELTHRGNKLFRKYAQELDIPLKNTGSLVNTASREGIKDLERLYRQGRDQGIEKLSIIIGNQPIKAREPNISHKVCASLYAPDACIVSPYEAAIAAYENAKANGVIFLLGHEVQQIQSGKQFRLHSGNVVIEAGYVANAAGLYADRIAAMIGDRSFKINPVKGQYFILDRETGNFVNHINFPLTRGREKRSKGILVAPTVGKNLLVGPNYQPCDAESLDTSWEGHKEIKKKASNYFPHIPFDKIITSFAGIRAVSDSNDFIAASSQRNSKFINMGGIQSPGLTCAFALAERAIDMLSDCGLKLKPDKKYNPVRSSIKSLNQDDYLSNRSLYNFKPGYGRIICRCEKVTEAEIIEAISRGARTVDSIKFRTRAGMGRCQGGYCSLKIVNILSRELGIPAECITKKGNLSPMTGRRMQ